MSLRVFTAIDLTSQVIRSVQAFQRKLAEQVPPILRWTKAEQLHITLKFVAALQENHLPPIISDLSHALQDQPCFSLNFQEAGVFPHLRSPRILWIGLQSSDALQTLFKINESIFKEYGYAPEKRPFQAHITIGRFKDDCTFNDLQMFRNVFSSLQKRFKTMQKVDHLTLYESTLTPHGPLYEIRDTITFQA